MAIRGLILSQSHIILPPESEQGDTAIYWVGSSEKDLAKCPSEIKRTIGFVLRFAQRGSKHPLAKPLKGYQGAGVLEVVKTFDGDAYRVVYTICFERSVYVLHCFQKKSNIGIETPEKEMRVIRARLQQVESIHKAKQERY